MAFEILLTGVPHAAVCRQLVELIGAERVSVADGHLVLSAPDQAAVVGVLNSVNEFGCTIHTVRRTGG